MDFDISRLQLAKLNRAFTLILTCSKLDVMWALGKAMTGKGIKAVETRMVVSS